MTGKENTINIRALPSSTATQTYHRHKTREGVTIFYREAGPADAPTLVLLHGYPSSSRMYERLIPFLATRYHIIAPDYPGFGLSDAPAPANYHYTFDNLAQTIGQFLDEIGLARFTLFMQDYGGPVGFRIAMAQPEKILGIIVQNANAYEEGLGEKWKNIALYWQDPTAHPEQPEGFMSYEGARQRHIGNSPDIERFSPDEWEDEFAMLSRPGSYEIHSALLYDYQNNVKSYPLWQAWMRQHQPPALVLWGKYDPSFIVPGAEAYRRDLPESELHILEAGHFALDEANEEVAALTLAFLEKQNR